MGYSSHHPFIHGLSISQPGIRVPQGIAFTLRILVDEGLDGFANDTFLLSIQHQS